MMQNTPTPTICLPLECSFIVDGSIPPIVYDCLDSRGCVETVGGRYTDLDSCCRESGCTMAPQCPPPNEWDCMPAPGPIDEWYCVPIPGGSYSDKATCCANCDRAQNCS